MHLYGMGISDNASRLSLCPSRAPARSLCRRALSLARSIYHSLSRALALALSHVLSITLTLSLPLSHSLLLSSSPPHQDHLVYCYRAVSMGKRRGNHQVAPTPKRTPKGGANGIVRTHQNGWDLAAKEKTVEYFVVSIDGMRLLPDASGTMVDHFRVGWDAPWDLSANKTWEPAHHLKGHEDKMQPLLDKRDLDVKALEAEAARKAAAWVARKAAQARAVVAWGACFSEVSKHALYFSPLGYTHPRFSSLLCIICEFVLFGSVAVCTIDKTYQTQVGVVD
jgi:hypothetical protein